MLGFSCPSCQRKLSVQDEHAGKKIKCSGCGAVSVAPDPAPPKPPPIAVASSAPAAAVHKTNPLDQTRDFAAGRLQHDPALTNFLAPGASGR